MSYQVELNEIVNYEINSALEYIEYTLFAPMAAQKLWNKIEEKKKFLAKNPYMYSVVPNKRLAKFGIRFVMIGNYLLFFTIDEQEKSVIVINFIYGRRDWHNMFL